MSESSAVPSFSPVRTTEPSPAPQLRPRAPRGPAGLGPLSPSAIGAPLLGSGLPGVPRPRRVGLPRTDPVITDAVWERIEPLIPQRARRRRYPGRKPLDDRAVLTGILVVLARGIGFERLPNELGFGSGMTCWRRLRDWQQAGAWNAIAAELARGLPDGDRIDFDRVAATTTDADTESASPVTRRPVAAKAKHPSPVAAEFGMTLLR
ncbi:MAG TPA: transposase [Actinocrinis sp.]|nr:transposase [Actinocrinis sp.]